MGANLGKILAVSFFLLYFFVVWVSCFCLFFVGFFFFFWGGGVRLFAKICSSGYHGGEVGIWLSEF